MATMDSQQDMFLSQPELQQTQGSPMVKERMTSSCPVELSNVYSFIILFNWSENVKNPFKNFSRSSFSNDEIKDYCLKTKLKDAFRVKKLKPMKSLPGKRTSLFAKVEASKVFFTNTMTNNLK